MTPPPTWTPVLPPATPAPPRPRPTQPPPEATPVPDAQPWIWLQVEPLMAAPGMTVTARLELRNVGGSTLHDAVATLGIPVWLQLVSHEATAGTITAGAEHLEWRLGAMDGGAEAFAVVNLAVSLDAPPGRDLELAAEFGGIEDRATVSLPWALLPEAGRP